nr:mucin-2-like [Dermacentor andersoni]
MGISADRRRSDTARPMACVGCFRKLSAAEKVKSLMVTRSPERSPFSTRFSISTTGDNSPSSNIISSTQDNRRIQASRSLSHTRSATPLKENRSSAVPPTVEPSRALPTSVTSRKALPSTSTPVNFKSTRKKCFRKAKLRSRIDGAQTRTRSNSLPSERKPEASQPSVSASELSTANLSNDAADVNALQKNITAMNKFFTTTAPYKQNTHDNAGGVRSVAATTLETSTGPELKETAALDKSPSIGTVHMSFVERTPVVTEALLNSQNFAPPLTSGINPRTSGVGIVITESSVLRTQEDGRRNSSKDLLEDVPVPEILRNATVKVHRHQDDGRTKTGTTPVAYTNKEVSLLQSSEDVTDTTGEKISGPEEAEKPKEIKNKSSDSPPSQNEASMTDLDDKRTTNLLQMPGADKREQSIEEKMHVGSQRPLPFQVSRKASLESVPHNSTGVAIPVELTTTALDQQSLKMQETTTERFASKYVSASDTLAKLPETELTTVLTLTWAPKTTAHSAFPRQTAPLDIRMVMSSAEQRGSAESRRETTSTIATTAGSTPDQNTGGGIAGIDSAAVSTVSKESNNGKLKVALGSTVKTRAGIREDEKSTWTTESTDATVPLPTHNINTPYIESYSRLSTEREAGFVSLHTTTHDARPHTSEDMLEESLPVLEPISEATLLSYAPRDPTDLAVSTLPSPYLVTLPAELTDKKYEDTSRTSSNVELQGEAPERENQADLKRTLTIEDKSTSATDSRTNHSEGYYEANKVDNALPPTVGTAAMLPPLTVKRSDSLPLSVTASYTETRTEPKAVIWTENDRKATTTVSADVVSLFLEKHVTNAGGKDTQSTNIFYPSNTSSQETSTTPLSAALLPYSSPPSNLDLTTIVTTPTLCTSIKDDQLQTIAETSTQKTKAQTSHTDAINDFDSKVNTVMSMHRNDTENVAPLNQIKETYPMSKVSNGIRENLNAHSNKQGLAESQKYNDSSSNIADEQLASTNTVFTSIVSTTEAYGHHTPIAVIQELATAAYHNAAYTTQTPKDVESSEYSPTTEGNRSSVTKSAPLEDLGPDVDTKGAPRMTPNNLTTQGVVLKETSTKTPLSDATTPQENETGDNYSTIAEDFQGDSHDASLSLSELHLSKSSGGSKFLNPSITIHLTTRYHGETNGAIETASDTPRAISKEVRTDAATDVTYTKTPKTSTRSPQLFTEKVLPKEVENHTSSKEHLPFKSTVDTNAHLKIEASTQDWESPTTVLFRPSNDAEWEHREDNLKSDKSGVGTPVASPLSTVILHINTNPFSTVSEEGSSMTSDKTSTVRPQLTREMNEYATLGTETLVTLGTTTFAPTVTSALMREKTQTRTALSIPSSRLQEKTTKAPLCKSTFGLFRHPTNCNLFVQCSYSVAFIKKCPANLHFNEEIMVCDWPYRAGCLSNASKSQLLM